MYGLVFSEFAAWFLGLETVRNIFIGAILASIFVPAVLSLWVWRDNL